LSFHYKPVDAGVKTMRLQAQKNTKCKFGMVALRPGAMRLAMRDTAKLLDHQHPFDQIGRGVLALISLRGDAPGLPAFAGGRSRQA